MSINRREFFRVTFNQPMGGNITMSRGGLMYITLDNLSVNGLGFTSSVDLPLLEKVDCSFRFYELQWELEGSIKRKTRKYGEFEYGIAFKIDQDTASLLFKELNAYEIRQKKGTYRDYD